MKKFLNYILDIIKEEYKFIILLILLYIILQFPLNYYIITGGGSSDVASRIKVSEGNKHKGSFNISYVTELEGNVTTYLLSYIIPKWDRESVNDYKYTESESIEDIDFRGDLDLKVANSNATYWAYTLANKSVEEMFSKIYVTVKFDKYSSNLKVGDEILSIDGNSYRNVQEYKNYIQSRKENDEVVIRVIRKEKEMDVKTKIYKEKDSLLIGVVLETLKKYQTDPKVSISFRRSESGPSAGLITTLEIYNQLVNKDITHGLKIAGTGTIEPDGSIGEIGGVEYKILGADSSKADIFLVPSGNNYKDALKYKKKKNLKIKLIEVESIEDALNKLEKLK